MSNSMINYITYTADIKNIYTYLFFPIKSSFLFSSNFYNENIVSYENIIK